MNIIIIGLLHLYLNFFKQFDAKITKSEIVDTHGGSIRIYIKKNKKS